MESFDLTSLLTNLQLEPSTSQAETSRYDKFTLFPTLPTELRLKIISHALPAHGTLPLSAKIIVADPAFGLYLSFIAHFSSSTKTGGFGSPKGQRLSLVRAVNLLLVNREFNTCYAERFPLSLPTGDRGVGKIRFAASEVVQVRNFEDLLHDDDFARGISQRFRLQGFWNDVERIVVPISSSIWRPVSKIRLEVVIRRFGNLRQFRTSMWEGFNESDGGDTVRTAIKAGMEGHLNGLRRDLKSLEMEEGYIVPGVVLE